MCILCAKNVVKAIRGLTAARITIWQLELHERKGGK